MDRENVIIYLNSTGDMMVDQKAVEIAEDFCKARGYNVVNCIGEDTRFDGISFPMKYMLVGLAAEEKIDKVISIGSFMLGDTDKVLDLIDVLEDYNVYVETVADDMSDMYELLFAGNPKSEENEPGVDEFLASLASLFSKDN